MNTTKDPFRIFFPIGAILALAGVFPWSLHIFGFPSYPVEFHRAIMMNGFMLAFVSGFLMTAIPRFTSTGFAKSYEVFAVLAFILAGVAFEFVGLPAFHHLTAAIALLTLIAFAAIRFKARQNNPPFTFVFVGIGLILWTVSNFMIFWSLHFDGMRPGPFSIWGDLFSNGALMSIVLGVSGRLIPGILGWQEIVTTQRQQYESSNPFLSVVPKRIWFLVFVYLCSFFFAPILPSPLPLFFRAIAIWSFAFIYWNLHKFPNERSYLSWSVWLSCWCFTVGSAIDVIWVNSYVHSLHMMLIGGFSLLTVLVSTRVTLAHGPHGRGMEKTSLFIPIFTALLLFATVTRVTAELWPAIYLNHLSYASLTWIAGFTAWAIFSVPKMLAR